MTYDILFFINEVRVSGERWMLVDKKSMISNLMEMKSSEVVERHPSTNTPERRDVRFSELHFLIKNAFYYALMPFDSDCLGWLITKLFMWIGPSLHLIERSEYSYITDNFVSDKIDITFNDSSKRHGALSLDVDYHYAKSKTVRSVIFDKYFINDPFYNRYENGRKYIDAIKIIIYRLYFFLEDFYKYNDAAKFTVSGKFLKDNDYIKRFIESFKIIADYETDSRIITRFLRMNKDKIGSIIDLCTESGYSELLMMILRMTDKQSPSESGLKL